jgi:hypothetical protein
MKKRRALIPRFYQTPPRENWVWRPVSVINVDLKIQKKAHQELVRL